MHTKTPSAVVRLIAILLIVFSTGSVIPAAQAALKTVYETQEITLPDGDVAGPVSISGNLAIIGIPDLTGAANIYAFDGTSWNFQAELQPFSGYGEPHFGLEVAISGDVAMVGAPFDDTFQVDGGVVYVYQFDGTTWQFQDILHALQPKEGAFFGYSISISGTKALIGASGGAGAAFVFAFNGEAWSQQAELTPDDGGLRDSFGRSVSLTGNRALVGAPANGDTGTAYVFDFDGTAWNQSAKLVSPANGRSFGESVSLSGDTALIGAPNTAGSRGAAYIYSFDGASWSETAKLRAGGGQAYDYLGSSVALSGAIALVGARHQLDTGKIYEFLFRQNEWKLRAELVASDGTDGNSLGSTVALSGKTVFGSARQAYIFSLGGQP